jgi:hypothetical protein
MRLFRFLPVAAALIALSVAPPRSNAGTISLLFNTGTNSSNTTAGVLNMSADLHYSVVSSPVGPAPGAGGSDVVAPPPGTFPVGPGQPWFPNNATANWTSGPLAPGNPPQNPTPNGSWDYQTTYSASDAGAVTISGFLSGDDRITSILINGVAAVVTPVGTLPTTDQGYGAMYAFTATAPGHAGITTLDFIDSNTHLAIEGLRVDSLTGFTASTIPEPASILMLGCGLLGIVGLGALRRKKSN